MPGREGGGGGDGRKPSSWGEMSESRSPGEGWAGEPQGERSTRKVSARVK